jgi:hypothetical protein
MLPEVKEYRSNDYHFSVNYPADIPPQEFHERGHALTVAFQAKAGEAGVQIYVAPIIGTQITDERFLMDGPSGVRKDQTKTSVDAQALTFHGFDAGAEIRSVVYPRSFPVRSFHIQRARTRAQ